MNWFISNWLLNQLYHLLNFFSSQFKALSETDQRNLIAKNTSLYLQVDILFFYNIWHQEKILNFGDNQCYTFSGVQGCIWKITWAHDFWFWLLARVGAQWVATCQAFNCYNIVDPKGYKVDCGSSLIPNSQMDLQWSAVWKNKARYVVRFWEAILDRQANTEIRMNVSTLLTILMSEEHFLTC